MATSIVPHPRLSGPADAMVTRLGPAALAELRGRTLEELATAVRGRAEAGHLCRIAALVDAIDARIDEAGDEAPCLARRLTIAAEADRSKG